MFYDVPYAKKRLPQNRIQIIMNKIVNYTVILLKLMLALLND
jgi:hypothetical protein